MSARIGAAGIDTMRRLLLGSLLLSATACSTELTTPPECAGILIPALSVTIRDSLTGAFIGAGTTLLATGPESEVDTIVRSTAALDSATILIGSEPGSYQLAIRKPGYASWIRTSILVPTAADGCHPSRVGVQANMMPVRFTERALASYRFFPAFLNAVKNSP